MDLAGLDASPAEIGALMDALAEYDAEADTWGGAYDADGQAAADWIDGMSDSEFSEMLAEYEADATCPAPSWRARAATARTTWRTRWTR